MHHHGSVRLNGHNYELAERQGAENMANAALQAQAGTGTIGVRRTSTGDLIPHHDHLSRAARRGAAANLIQALASVVRHVDEHDETDRQIRLELPSRLQQQSWTDFGSRNGLNSLIQRSEG